MCKKDLDELWRLIDETEGTDVKELNSYKLLSGLEHHDICFHVSEGSIPWEDDLGVSTSEDVRTISDSWR